MADIMENVAGKLKISKDLLTKICIGVVAVIAVLCVLKVVGGGGGYVKPFKAYAKAISKNDAKKYTKTMSDDMLKYIEEKKGVDDIEDYYSDSIDNTVDAYEKEYGDDIKVTYKLVDKIKLTKDELEDLNDAFDDDKDWDFGEIKKGYQLVFKVTVKGDDEKTSYLRTAEVVKVKGKWVDLRELY